ncbi:hypothetical protein ACFL6I_19370, partial [candidate division KSB1 bacterium]
MVKKDIPKKKSETNIVLPRNYGVVVQSGSNACFYDPMRYILGHVILSTQPQLFAWLEKWQKFKAYETEQKNNGTLPYTPKFPVEGIEDLLEIPVEEVEDLLLAKIQKKEGSKNLWTVGGAGSIDRAKLYGKTLEAEIKSKSWGFNKVHISRPFLNGSGVIQHSDIYCSAPEGNYESQKNLRVMCSHAAALETAQFMQLKGIRNFMIDYGSRNIKNYQPILAFDFVSNPFLTNLEVDALLAHYIKGEAFYKINRKLADIPDHFSAALNRTGQVGKAKFAVMRQKAKDFGRSRSYQEVETPWANRIREKIKNLGYKRKPFYTVVFKDSPHEMIAERYESKDGKESIELAFSFDYAPIVVKKRLYGDTNLQRLPNEYPQNPFLNIKVDGNGIQYIGSSARTIDDCTRKECIEQVFVPKSLPISKKMLSVYSRLSN